MSDGLTCPRCRRISSMPSSADRGAGRGYVCPFCGSSLIPFAPRRAVLPIESARASRTRAEQLMLRMQDVTPTGLPRLREPAALPERPREATPVAAAAVSRHPAPADVYRWLTRTLGEGRRHRLADLRR
jgi:hypothetical protein